MAYLKVIGDILYLVDVNHVIYLYNINNHKKITELIGH